MVARKILVTGHCGYIGAVLVPRLIQEGHQVIGLDTGYFEEPNAAVALAHVQTLKKDIRDITETDLQGCDAVMHLAALCNDPLSDLKPEWTQQINYLASLRLANVAKNAGVRRFIYSSSCSMYGASTGDLATEDAPLSPLTPYAVSKVQTEQELSRLADSRFSPVYLRNATAYGWSPRLRADVVLNNLMCWACTTGKVHIMSDGSPWRPIVHVQDISLAFLAALTAPREAIHDQAFNIGITEENYRVREIAEIVRETVPDSSITYGEQRSPDKRNYRVDFSKAARLLPAFQPAWNARRGAEELYREFGRIGLTRSDFEGRKYIRLNQLKHLISQQSLDEELRWSKRHTAQP